MQQTHPSDEPDQGAKGTEGPDTHASIWKNTGTLTARGNTWNSIQDNILIQIYKPTNTSILKKDTE